MIDKSPNEIIILLNHGEPLVHEPMKLSKMWEIPSYQNQIKKNKILR